MRIIVATGILLLILSASAHAIEVKLKGWDAPPYEFTMESDTGKYSARDVKFPLVFYLFGGETFYKKLIATPEIHKKLPEGVTLPLYIGYIVADPQYHIRFVDKSGGYADHLADLVDQLNLMGPQEKVCDDQWGCVSRWNLRGFWMGKKKLLKAGGIDVFHMTMGITPDGSYVPRFEKVVHGNFRDSANLTGLKIPILQSIQSCPPGRSVSKQNKLAQ